MLDILDQAAFRQGFALLIRQSPEQAELTRVQPERLPFDKGLACEEVKPQPADLAEPGKEMFQLGKA